MNKVTHLPKYKSNNGSYVFQNIGYAFDVNLHINIDEKTFKAFSVEPDGSELASDYLHGIVEIYDNEEFIFNEENFSITWGDLKDSFIFVVIYAEAETEVPYY